MPPSKEQLRTLIAHIDSAWGTTDYAGRKVAEVAWNYVLEEAARALEGGAIPTLGDEAAAAIRAMKTRSTP